MSVLLHLCLVFFSSKLGSRESRKNQSFSPPLAPRCTEDEKRALYARLDPSGGGAGISCVDLVGFIEEGPTSYDDVDTAFEAATVAVQDEEAGVGKLLRRAQATIVEAAQVPTVFNSTATATAVGMVCRRHVVRVSVQPILPSRHDIRDNMNLLLYSSARQQ